MPRTSSIVRDRLSDGRSPARTRRFTSAPTTVAFRQTTTHSGRSIGRRADVFLQAFSLLEDRPQAETERTLLPRGDWHVRPTQILLPVVHRASQATSQVPRISNTSYSGGQLTQRLPALNAPFLFRVFCGHARRLLCWPNGSVFANAMPSFARKFPQLWAGLGHMFRHKTLAASVAVQSEHELLKRLVVHVFRPQSVNGKIALARTVRSLVRVVENVCFVDLINENELFANSRSSSALEAGLVGTRR